MKNHSPISLYNLCWSCLLLILLFPFGLRAQETNFRHVNAELGITMRQINSVCKFRHGFVWASSKSGVLRLTDSDFRVYQLPFQNNNVISVKTLMLADTLWCYSNNGQIFRYNSILDRFEFVNDISRHLNYEFLNINDIIVDPLMEGAMLIPTSKGVYRFHHNQFDRIGKDSTTVRVICMKDRETVFVARDEHLSLLNLDSQVEYGLCNYDYFQGISPMKMFYDEPNQRLWLGTSDMGLYYLDLVTRKVVKTSINTSGKMVRDMERIDERTMLVGIDGEGILKVDLLTFQVLNTYRENIDRPLSLSGNGVHDILYDEEDQQVWVATYSGGLNCLNLQQGSILNITHQINEPNSLGSNVVHQSIKDNEGDLWYATDNGVSCFRTKTNRWVHYYRDYKGCSLPFFTLIQDNDGRIWAGSYSAGFFILDRATGRELEHHYHNDLGTLPGKYIYDFYKDSVGDIWIGGLGDFVRYDSKNRTLHRISNSPVRALYELDRDTMAMACTFCTYLINKHDGRRKLICNSYSQDLQVVGKDLFIATCGHGLLRFNTLTRKTDTLTVDDGLPSNYINSLLYTDGRLWMGTENGFCSYRIKDEGEDRSPRLQTYSFGPSMNGVSFSCNSSSLTADGRQIWGTTHGAFIFETRALDAGKRQGRIFIQDLSVRGVSIRELPHLLIDKQPIDLYTHLTLSHEENIFSVEVLPLGVSQDYIRFQWMLEGVDRNWNAASTQRIITYSNIPVGRFKMKIRMMDSSLSHVIDERTLSLEIVPPFWATWWFRLSILVMLAILGWFIFRFYYNRLKQRHDEDKIRFFTRMAHEIRTSLTLISAPVQEVMKAPELGINSRYFLDLTARQIKSLNEVTTRLLDFEKLDVGRGQLLLGQADLAVLLRNRKLMFDSLAVKKGLSITLQMEVINCPLVMDEVKIEKVIDNLLSNALKYSPSGSTITLRLHVDERLATVSVIDQGEGISKRDQKRLFHEYYRADNATNSKVIGSGIGLIIAKRYVEMHHGKLTLESQEGKGANFSFTLPLNLTMPVATQADKPLTEMSRGDHSSDVSHSSDASHGSDASGATCTHISRKTSSSVDVTLQEVPVLLVVEDNEEMRDFLARVLGSRFEVQTAEDGQEAWEWLQDHTPDFIISDVMMPRMDGFELCKRVKSKFESSHIPFILLSALCDRSNQLEGLGYGADDYIAKPFDMEILSQRIEALLLNRQRILRRLMALQEIARRSEDEQHRIMTDKMSNFLRVVSAINHKQHVVHINNPLNEEFVLMAMKVANDNISNVDFDKEAFAQAMDISTSLLYKKLKALLDQSPSDFIKHVRLAHAVELLRDKEHTYSISEISDLCGFSSQSYFCTVFKREFGVPPTQADEISLDGDSSKGDSSKGDSSEGDSSKKTVKEFKENA